MSNIMVLIVQGNPPSDESAGMAHQLTPHQFNHNYQQWVAVDAPIADLRLASITCITFNVWFSSYYFKERSEVLLQIARHSDADIIAFQEVTPPLLSKILSQQWIREYYFVSTTEQACVEPYNLLLLSRFQPKSIQVHPLPSNMQRNALIAEFSINGRRMLVGVVHLESQFTSSYMRAEQLRTVFSILEDVDHVILLGDFNFCGAWHDENSNIDQRYQDVWPMLKPNEPGYTEDTDLNIMRLQQTNYIKHVRFDKVLLRSPLPGWRPISIHLVGTEPVAPELPNIFPSDHFGLVMTAVWSEGDST